MKYSKLAHNRSVYASPPSAARTMQYTSRAYALCGVLLRHIFLCPKKCFAFFLIGRKKTSYTAGTLCAIVAKYETINQKYLKKENKWYIIIISFIAGDKNEQ
jgi:hypothetical protein